VSTKQAVTDLLDIEWLTSRSAALALELANESDADPLAIAKHLRKTLNSEQVRLVCEQMELRRRAAEKFTAGQRMFFTRRGLEQASDEAVARYKAGRLPRGQPIADLCCGIGGDLMALALRGAVTGIERDPVTAALARANLKAACSTDSSQPPRVLVEDVNSFLVTDCSAWHIDPDRRPEGRRTSRVDLAEPGAHVVARLLGECPNAAIKLAPAAMFSHSKQHASDRETSAVPWQDAELEWISRKRECRQLVAWLGSLANNPGQRRATVLANDLAARGDELVRATFVGQPNLRVPVAPQIGRFVFEPDAAVLAGNLTGALAGDLALQAVAEGVAYLTADKGQSTPLLDAFEVLDVMPYRPRALTAWLRARGIGRLEVKKRGVDLNPVHVRRELKVKGDLQATLLLCCIGRKATAILARRL
jgi:hypothetical protein